MISGRAAAIPDAPAVTAVVPTVGRSPWLADSLAALRAQRGAGAIEILVVDQADAPLQLPPGLADRILRPGRNLGFAGGTNLGIAAARGDFVATVNDDASDCSITNNLVLAVIGIGSVGLKAEALVSSPTNRIEQSDQSHR